MPIKKVGLIALFACITVSQVFGGALTNYTVGDVLVCFRVSGKDNLVVDAGPISMFTNTTANQVIPITQYTPNQLATVGTNGLTWSAFSWFDDSVTPVSAQWTLFVSTARTSLSTQTTPWAAQNAASQANPAGDMAEIPIGALENIGYNANNTPTAIVEPANSINNPNYPNGFSYVDAIYTQNQQPNFNGDLDGNPENTTAGNFIKGGVVNRSDFYWVPPTDSGNAVKFLGYFELNTNGAMRFVAYPAVTASAPTVTTTAATGLTNNGATLNGTVNPSSQTTTAYFQYGLTTSYGSNLLVSTSLNGSSALAVNTNYAGFSFGQTYHFRLVAYNATGTNFGSDQTFATAAIPAPRATAYARSNTNSLISFATYPTLTYTLRGTNNMGAPVANWPVIATIPGDGSVHTITNGTTGASMFYSISAQ